MEQRVRTRSKGISKRQNILGAAAKVLAENGYAGMTLQNVADEIGIYAASIYYYFPSRDDLVREVAITALQKYQRVIEDVLEAMSPHAAPIDKIKQAIRSIVLMYTSQNVYFLAYERMVGQLPQALSSEIRQHRLSIRQIWNGLLEDAQASGEIAKTIDLRLLRLMILGTTHWITQWYDPEGDRSPEEIATEYLNIILNGVAMRPGVSSR